MDNIKESKEYQLAKDWERAVNDYGFNPKRFAAAIPEMHPTLQQSLYRLVKECIIIINDFFSGKPTDRYYRISTLKGFKIHKLSEQYLMPVTRLSKELLMCLKCYVVYRNYSIFHKQ